MRFTSIVLLTISLIPCVPAAWSQTGEIAPPTNLVTEGIPKIPASLARDVGQYRGIYGLPLLGWNPAKREIWLKGLSSVTWISRVSHPGAAPATSSVYIKSSGIYDIYLQPEN